MNLGLIEGQGATGAAGQGKREWIERIRTNDKGGRDGEAKGMGRALTVRDNQRKQWRELEGPGWHVKG